MRYIGFVTLDSHSQDDARSRAAAELVAYEESLAYRALDDGDEGLYDRASAAIETAMEVEAAALELEVSADGVESFFEDSLASTFGALGRAGILEEESIERGFQRGRAKGNRRRIG